MKYIHSWQEMRLNKVIIKGVIGFVLSFFIGYFLGLIKLHNTLTENSTWKYWQQVGFQSFSHLMDLAWINLALNWFVAFSPSLGFLSDVVAYQAAVVAIAIPVSLEIISRISERYQSGVITKEFNKQWQLRVLLRLTIANVLLAVMLKFFISSNSIVGYWKFLAWLVFLVFIVTNVILLFFFKMLQHYTTNTKFLLNRLFNRVTKILHAIALESEVSDLRLKLIHQSQTQLIDALEGIGDILVFEIRSRKSNSIISNSLKLLEEKVQNVFHLQQSHPEIYERLSNSKEFFQLQAQNYRAAELNLSIFPEKYQIFLTTAINQLIRFYDSALEIKNFDIAILTIYHIIWLLKYLSQKLGNFLPIEAIVQKLAKLRSNVSVNHDGFAYTLSIDWYINIFFEDEFNLVYLCLFDRYFIPTIRQIISDSDNALFQMLVQTLIESAKLQRYSIHLEKFERFQNHFKFQSHVGRNQNSQILHQFKQLSSLLSQVRTVKQLEECQSLIYSIGSIIPPSLNQFPKEAEAEKEIEALKAESNFVFKFNHLIDVVFDLGAYCLFKQRFEEIQYLWNYKQPLDADAIWLGHNILPHTLPGLINFYFFPSLSERGLTLYWEAHHGSRRYYNLYFLLLLLREFQNVQISSNEAREKLISSFQLPPNFNSHRLNEIAYEVENFLLLARELKEMPEMLQRLGFQRNEVEDAIEYGLIPFIESLKPSVHKHLEQIKRTQQISQNKVDIFKTDFLAGYNQQAMLRFLFQDFNLYEARLDERGDECIPTFCIKLVFEKQNFLDNWYVDCRNLGTDCGYSFAKQEDTQLMSEIVSHCILIEGATIESILERFDDSSLDSLIIVGVNYSAVSDFISPAQFYSKSDKDSFNSSNSGFVGSYTYADRQIPIFGTFVNKLEDNLVPEKFTLVLDCAKLGILEQYSPIENNEQEHLVQHLVINIQSLVEQPELMDTFLQAPPSWLSAGDIVSQRSSLEVKVLMQVYERFKLDIAANFQGYLIYESNIT